MICKCFWLVTLSIVKMFGKSPHSWPKVSFFTVTHAFLYMSRPTYVSILKTRQGGRFLRTTFSNALSSMKSVNFDWNFAEICFDAPINIMSPLVQILARRRCAKPLFESKMAIKTQGIQTLGCLVFFLDSNVPSQVGQCRGMYGFTWAYPHFVYQLLKDEKHPGQFYWVRMA